jgi:hypothetical protein
LEEKVNIFTTISDEQLSVLCNLGYKTPEILFCLMQLENGKFRMSNLLNMNDESFVAFVDEVYSMLTEEQRLKLSEEPEKYSTGLVFERDDEEEESYED